MIRAGTVLAALAASCAPACAGTFVPADDAAIALVRERRTAGFVTIARTLTTAEQASHGAFAVTGYQVVRKPGVPFARVLVCYRLGIDPPDCGLGYRVAVDPPHVEPEDRFDGLGRDLEQGPRAFLKALARQETLQRQPAMLRRLQEALEPYDPYDWR